MTNLYETTKILTNNKERIIIVSSDEVFEVKEIIYMQQDDCVVIKVNTVKDEYGN